MTDSANNDDANGGAASSKSDKTTAASSSDIKAAAAASSKATIKTRAAAMSTTVDIGPLEHGVMEYHDTARIVSVRANALVKNDDDTAKSDDENTSQQSVVVACAGTTNLPVAEEAALTLSLSGIPVIRIYNCGVAGLHRIISALPKLRHPNVGCVIVCAGMDGALPSVVGGLVNV